MALTLGATLVVVGVPAFVMWVSWRATTGVGEGGREPVDMVAMSAPVVNGIGQERLSEVQVPVMPPGQEPRAPAATIVEMPVQRVEQPRSGESRLVGTRAGVAGGRPPREAVRASQREVVRASAASAKSKAVGERKAEARRPAPLSRAQSAAPKPVAENVDADVQVIEAIVTRAR